MRALQKKAIFHRVFRVAAESGFAWVKQFNPRGHSVPRDEVGMMSMLRGLLSNRM